MIILLDENLLSRKLKQPFLAKGYDVCNVDDMGWRGFKDSEILNLAENHPFNAFITADKNLRYQQNLVGKILRIVILDARSTRPDYLLPLMERISEMITSLSAGVVISINDSCEFI
jgi:predicted nuclease of predicted toxin-antitoxin system